MPEMARSAASSSVTERGETPEVAALGNTLADLFKTLGVSQKAYAVRIGLDATTVSRFLSGRRVATEDFIERLIREAEQKLGSPLVHEVKAEVHRRRMAALRSTNPAGYELECLRQEMMRSQRTIARLTRQEEALHDLLAKRESEILSVRGELDSLHRDWSADLTAATGREAELRIALDDHTTVRDALLAEITRLRADLADTSALRADAETRCRDLEDRVLAMEEELAELHREGGGPIGVLLGRLEGFRSSGDVRTLGRELADVAWARPAEEIVVVLRWLGDAGESSRAESLLRDAAQSRPLGVVTEIGDVMPQGPFQALFMSHLVRCAARFRSVPELAALHRHSSGGTWPASDDVLVCLLQTDRPAVEVLEVISLLSDEAASVLPSLSAAASAYRPPDRVVAVLAELAHRGDEHLVRAPLGHLMRNVHATGLGQPFAADLLTLPEDRRHALLTSMAGAPLRTLLDFLDTLNSSPRTAEAAAELLERVEATGRGADVRSYQGKRARAYPHHELEEAADGG